MAVVRKQQPETDVFNTGRIVEVDGRSYRVREIPWPEFKIMLAKLQSVAEKVRDSGFGLDKLSVDELLAHLPALVDVGGVLFEEFVYRAVSPTDEKVNEEWIGGLGFGTFMRLAEEAFAQNREGLDVFFRLLRSGFGALLNAGASVRTQSRTSSTTPFSSPGQASDSETSSG